MRRAGGSRFRCGAPEGGRLGERPWGGVEDFEGGLRKGPLDVVRMVRKNRGTFAYKHLNTLMCAGFLADKSRVVLQSYSFDAGSSEVEILW